MRDGKPFAFVFYAFDDKPWRLTMGDLVARKVSVIGKTDFKIGDEIITYWREPDQRLCYNGWVTEIDEG